MIKDTITLFFDRRKWRKLNGHNFTNKKNFFDNRFVSVGKNTYGEIYVNASNNESKLVIGNYCSIANGVKFIVGGEHNLQTLSTYPFKVMINNETQEAGSKGDIIVGDDVWLGENAIILSGVKIGQGAVVGAGAVVTKDVPPYAIVCGVPAKVIKFRFNEEIIQELLKIDFSALDTKRIKANISELYKHITSREDVKKIKSLLKGTINDG